VVFAAAARGGDFSVRRLRADGPPYRAPRAEFLPDFQETDFLMHLVEKPGSSDRLDAAA